MANDPPEDPLDGLPDELREKAEKFALHLGETFLRSLILQGHILPDYDSEGEVRRKLLQAIRDIVEGKADLEVALDWRDSLLNWATTTASAGESRVAIILYATWLEHTLNFIASVCASRLPMSEQQASSLLRAVPLEGKLDWLLVLLELPPIEEEHKKTIKLVSEARNALVHYKWRPTSPFADQNESLDGLVVAAKVTVPYLEKYVDDNLVGYDEQHL